MSDRTWSPQQQAIFEWFKQGKGNLIVRARAGTGKSTTILQGIEHAPENKILLAAFNKRIAEELKTKLTNPNAEAKTLHALGFSFIMRNWSGVKVDSNKERVNAHAMSACGADTPDPILALVARLATLAKETNPFAQKGEELLDLQAEFDLCPEIGEHGQQYDDLFICNNAIKVMGLAKHRDGMIDFADMLYVPLVNGFIQPWFNLVCIDEAQDMNLTQLMLAQRCCKKGGRIVVVGDDRQAIYGFRGADSGSLDRLKTELKASELGLTTTYRCPKLVVAEAQKLVPDFNAAPEAPEGEIQQMDMKDVVDKVQVGDFIISRINAPLAGLCLRILRKGIRAKVEGKDIGRGLVSLVRKLGKSKSMTQFMERLTKWEDQTCAKWAAANKEAKVDEAHDKADTLRELSDGLTSLRELETRIDSLFADNVMDSPQVVLSTVHKIKGSEADRVFVLKDTLYCFKGAAAMQEEKNIHYVAITRAKKILVLVNGKVIRNG